MIKRSLLWVLAAYCIGIVFRDRLKWMLWAVLFSCVILGYAILRRKCSVSFLRDHGNFRRVCRYAGIRRYGYGRITPRRKRRKELLSGERVQRFVQEEKYFLMILLPALLAGAILGKMQAADYPIDAVLVEKTAAFAEGRIRSITETESGYRMELNHISVDLNRLAVEEQSEYTKGRLLVYCGSAEGLKIGNYIRLEGRAVPFAEPENAGQFDERAYYRAERMCCKFNADKIVVLNDSVDEIREWCRVIRSRLDSVYEEILPQKHAGIVSAILLGDKAELDADTKALYQKNGIAHILAISGLHVSLLGAGLFALIRKCGSPLIPAAATTMLILIFYGCLTEFSVSTQRAVGMLVIAMFAKILGRSYDSRSACALCGLFILVVNPMQLYQTGFQLSFAAAFGISYFGRELERMKLNKGKTVAEKLKLSILSGMTTQLITAPIILNSFYELPVYAMFLNLPVVGLLSAVVLLSILAGGAGIFSYSFGKFLAGGVYVILEFYESLCELVEKLPCPIWLYGKPQGWRIFAYFAVLVLFFAIVAKIGKRYQYHPRQHRYRRWAFSVLCLLPLVFVGTRSADDCVVDFISVGQGDCSVIRTENGSTYLSDCGSSSVTSVGEYRLKPWLKYHGISKLEAVFLSHPDSDHTNGVLELLEKTNLPEDWYRGEIQIKNLVLPAAYREEVEAVVDVEKSVEWFGEGGQSEEKGFVSIYKLARKNGIPVLWFDTGDKVKEDGLAFTCLHPDEDYPAYDTNDASMVLMLECQNTVILFTGDIGIDGEEHVLSRLDDKKTLVLKVAHHGSKNSTSEAFLEVAQPEAAVISCGKNNSFGHPHEETLERLQRVESEVVSTPESGTVTVRINEEGMVVTGYK